MTDLKFTSPSGETTIKVEDTGRLGTVAPKTQLHIKMNEPVKYETPMTENEEEIEKVKAQIKVLEKKLSFLVELEQTKSPDIIEIDGVKYQRVEEPPTLSNKLEEWIEILNFAQSKEHKDLLVIEILNIVKEFIPEPYDGVGLSEYFLGYNEAIRKMEDGLK